MTDSPDRDAPVDIKLPSVTIDSRRNAIVAAMSDLWRGLTGVRIWKELAWEQFIARYRRAYFGILWAVLGFVIFAMAILFFRGAVAGSSSGLQLGHVLFGFLAYQFLSSVIVDACMLFPNSRSWIESTNLPISTFVFKSVASNIFIFVFNSIGAASILLFAQYNFPPGSFWVLPAILVIFFNTIWVCLFLGIVMARFRDGAHLVQATMRMAIFLTPIMWVPVEGTMQSLIAVINPLTHFIDIFRVPLVSGDIPVLAWQVVGAITVLGYVLALITFTMFRRKIILWM